MEITIDLSDKRLFNNSFFYLYKSLQNNLKRYLIFFGGRGSGKSFSIAQNIVIEALMKKCKYIVFRSTLNSHNDTTYVLFRDLLKSWNVTDVIFNKHEKRWTFPNGSEIVLKGCDDPEKSKGLEGTSHIWFEEITSIDFSDFKTIDSALRGKYLINPKIIISFNPIDENHWVKQMLFDTEAFSKKAEYYHSTCLDNKFLSAEDIQRYADLKEYDYNLYRIEFLGQWGKTKEGGELYKHFDVTKQVKDFEYDSTLPLHISFDENVSPYLTLLIAQIKLDDENTEVRFIDEITIADYNLEMVCMEFLNRFGNHKSGLFVYGDASSNKRDAKLEQGYNFYLLIQRFLERMKPNLLISKLNPSVVMRTNFINNLFYKNDKVKITFHSRMKETIKDFTYVKRASDGGKDKSTQRNKISGVTEQKYGHATDAAEYLIIYCLMQSYNEFQFGGSTDFQPRLSFRSSHRW